MKIYRLASPIERLMEESLKYDSPEAFSNAYPVKRNLENHGIPINENGTVTLYHTTTPEIAEKIRESGVIKGGSTATGGMTGLALKPSAFFGWNKDWVQNTWGKGKTGLVEVNVPYHYIRQPAKNPQEIYFESGTFCKNHLTDVPEDSKYFPGNFAWGPIEKFFEMHPTTEFAGPTPVPEE